MEFSKPVSKLIRERRSSRKYSSESLSKEKENLIHSELLKYNSNQFIFNLVEDQKINRSYILGVITNKKFDNIDFGYTFEKIILFCTDIGLGTCWTGLFNKNQFSSFLDKKQFQKIGFLSPVGYSVDNSPRKTRKPWSEIFFNNKMQPLDKQTIPEYEKLLDMIRLAPSGMNLQPWRIIYNNNKLHFFVERKKGLIGFAIKALVIDMQLVDLGIAMCHFDLYSKETNLVGKWSKENNIEHPRNWQYVNTWVKSI